MVEQKDEAFAAKLEQAKDLNEVAKLFQEKGIDTDAEALQKYLESRENSGELDEAALEDVAGGMVIPVPVYWRPWLLRWWLKNKHKR